MDMSARVYGEFDTAQDAVTRMMLVTLGLAVTRRQFQREDPTIEKEMKFRRPDGDDVARNADFQMTIALNKSASSWTSFDGSTLTGE